MAAQGGLQPAVTQPGGIDQAAKWFWNFLKTELTPYPGRLWVVGRMTISATIVMLVVMVFRLPSGFLAAIFTLFLSRENPTATLRAGVRVVIAFTIATAYTIAGIMMLVDDPLTHFLWIMVTLFIAFYLVRIIPDYGTAVGFGFMTAGAIPLWDETTLNVNTRVENTLWLAFAVLLGAAVTILVEFIFRRVHPVTDLTEGIDNRLEVVEETLRNAAEGFPANNVLEKKLSLYASVGTSRLRRLLFRSGYSAHFIAQMSAGVSLLGRVVGLAASMRISRVATTVAAGTEDSQRCEHLANEVLNLRHSVQRGQLPRRIHLPAQPGPSGLPFLATMETTVSLIPLVFSGSSSIRVFHPGPMEEETHPGLLASDAFTNPAHLQFAVRGMLAAGLCYVVYTSIAWPGLSTCIATCVITALSTIGSSRQKQFLRLAGTMLGGFIFGMGAQIFILPYLDSIAGFTLLFAVVTAIAAWIGTASPRLSYLGIQMALAFYLINLQEFTIQTSLAVARNRVFGVLLGLISMWLVFDRLWVRDAMEEMQAVFQRDLRLFADLTDELLKEDRDAATAAIVRLREQINAGFQAVTAQADAIFFEFGSSRQKKLVMRANIKRWQPSLRTLLLVQITSSQFRTQASLQEMFKVIAGAHVQFEGDVARILRAMADEVKSGVAEAVPDIQASAAQLEQEIRHFYAGRGQSVSPQAADMISLTHTVATILAPLYEDIRSSLITGSPQIEAGFRQYIQGES